MIPTIGVNKLLSYSVNAIGYTNNIWLEKEAAIAIRIASVYSNLKIYFAIKPANK